MSNSVRTRLGVDERRAQLVEVGLELFSSRPYDEVWVEEVAERAGVSRGLMYHYFPSKRDFYVAVVREASGRFQRLGGSTDLRAAVRAYVDLAEEQRHGMLTTHRAGIGGDPAVRAILEEGRERQVVRICEQVSGGADAPPVLYVAVRGWLRLMTSTVVDWLERPELEREELVEFLVDAFNGLVTARLYP